jgi:hypothetical protein
MTLLAFQISASYDHTMALPRYLPHYALDDYREWEGDWELWSGVAVAMSPSAKRLHQEICGELFFRFREALAISACQEFLKNLDADCGDFTVSPNL